LGDETVTSCANAPAGPYGPPSGDPEEIRYWENFCKVVKNQQRFTTFLSLDDDLYDKNKPANFLFSPCKAFRI
jgi:hypothetical protein